MKRLGCLLLILPLLATAEVVVPIDSVENNVNIRMSPDAKADIVGRLDQGDWLTLVNSTPGWHEVEIAGGATGFISADWTKVLDEAPSVVEEAVAEAPDVTDEEMTAVEEPAEIADTSAEEAVVAEIEGPAEVNAVEDVAEPEVPAEPEPEVVAETTPPVEEPVDEDPVEVVEPVERPVPVEAVVEAEEEAPAEETEIPMEEPVAPVVVATAGEQGPAGPQGPMGPPGPQGPAGSASVEGSVDFLMKFTAPTIGGNSQVYDDGNFIGIGTTEPKQRLEVNGNIQIHERNSSVAGLMITQSAGDTGYIMHNRASTLTIGAGSIDRITIDRDGNVGVGVSRPSNPLELANGAHVTHGGVWTNASSRERKENIAALSLEDALATLKELQPVQFNYKNDQAEGHVGFIAEDVPDLVAMQDRDGLSAMDIVAVLTLVIQEQQRRIEALESALDQ